MQLLEHILGTKNSIKILRILIKHRGWEFNITELSKDGKINKGVLSRLVENLEEKNLIIVRRKGKIKLFQINQKNEFIKNVIIPLFDKEESFLNSLLEKIKKIKHKNLISLVLYGSVAAGKARLTSDIDVLVIVSRKDKEIKARINTLREDFLSKDFLLRVDVLTLNEWKRLGRMQEPFIREVLKNHKVLCGRRLSDLK
ncbi:MAG: nucleotidyltransferase domain-containing protein [Nanoarchaeota archaeon]|nr:nucleotidyltransferase domain-containing protein [Nanoarchaeota archaeon]